MKSKILSLLIWIISIITIIILLPLYIALWLLTVLFDRRLYISHHALSLWASIYTLLNPFWTVTIEGREKLNRNKTYIIISNHQSMLDILLLFRLYTHFRWVSKIEIFRVPVVGWIMTLNRYIKIRRGDKKSVLRMMNTCKKVLGSGISILMFPEGTRSLDGSLGDFKDGAFNLALETGTGILPVVICGASGAIPKDGYLLSRKQRIIIRILDEIKSEDFSNLSVSELRGRAYSNMHTELSKIIL